MNVPTHFSGQQSVQQVPGSSQLMANSLSSQMQNLGTYTNKMDTELLVKRKRTQEYIIQLLQRRNYNPNSELMQRIPEIAKRLEEHIFKDTLLQGQDYSSMSSSAIDLHLQGITKALCSSQQVHYIPSASVSTMIPTPGRTNYGNKGLTASQDNTLISSSTGGLIMQTAANTVNLSNSNGPVGMGQIASFTAPTGTIPNEYQQPLVNVIQNSGGTGIISSMGMVRQSSQMIPTPGLNNQQSLSTKPDSSIGGGFSSMNSPVTSQQQQKQYDGSQNNRLLHGLGMGGGLRSNIQQKSSPFNFHNVVMGGGMGGLVGSSMHHINGTAIPNGYLGPVSYAVSSKPLQQHLYKQQHQSLATASMPQKMVPLACDGYTMNTSDVLGSGNMYGCSSTSASTLNNQNSNSSMASKSNTNHLILTQTSLPSVQLDPQLKHQLSDTPQSMNFQSIHSTREQVQSHHQMQNCQHQQFQPSNQPCIQLIPSQRYENNKQQQQIISISDNLRQYSMESISEPLLSQDNEQFHFSELQNQFDDKTSIENLSQGAQALAQIQCPHLSQGAQALAQIQCPMNNLDLSSQISQKVWEAEQTKEESQNELSCLFVRSQTDAVSKKHWFSQSPQISCVKERLSFDQDMKEEENGAAVEAMPGAHAFVGHAIVPVSSNKMLHVSSREQAYLKQRRWLLLLLHSRKCPSPEGQCKEVNCITVQQLWTHIDVCNLKNCIFPRCYQSKKLLNHHWSCKVADCPVCIPVKEFITFFKVRCRKLSDTALASKTSNSWKNIRSPGDKVMTKSGSSHFEISDCIQPLTKRMKFQNSSLLPKVEASSISVLSAKQVNTPIDVAFPCKSEIGEVKMDTSLVDVWSPVTNPKLDSMSNTVLSTKSAMESCSAKAAEVLITKEIKPNDYKICEAKMQVSQDANIPPSDSATTASKSGKPKINGVSLIELFTVEQVRNHIIGLRQWIGQSKAKVEKNQALERSMTENSCQLCAVEKLTFEPPPIYCTLCGSRIKRNAMYYTVGTGDTRHYFCIPCYNEARCDTIEAEGSTFPKSRLEKKKNDEETEEWWVQCDKCEAWQHQICALFNGRRNDGGEAEYTCPNCYMEEVERGERKPLPQSTVLGAKDLPRTILSDHIEHRLFRRLKHERQERARHFGKSIDEVPGAEALVVRVVSSVDKKLDVKQRFLEIFQEENYPTEYLYKSKVILLFQKIEGVEVCLFGMYVQEFGSDCQFPNQRHVYLSYLDSVKYFRPEIRTVTGEALRTFVYHEILIGYLDYCKKRGFTSCYIWACPPLKGEDYILYCHPEIQKTPKSDKLREWYLSMLRKAVKENIVVGLTNLFDHFFVSNGESKAKVTAVRLPYFDGDYWPGAAEEMISQLRQDDDRKQQKKGKIKLTLTKRALKAAGHTDLGCNASKDAILMQKLGETISPMKDDFIMVHLQHACTHCCNLMVSGNRWVCHLCKHFQICDMCFEAEQKLDDRGRHPSNSRERHDLFPIEITGVLDDTKDKDEIIESEFFDTRQAFLSLCQGNHYQYDTLRRAKHSSMMVLYHLHNPTAPAFVTTCNVCYHDIETGQGWRCEVCPDFDVCNACYQKEGGIDHPHKLTNHPTNADCEAQSQEARKKRVLQLRSMLDLLVHASLCRSPYCQYPNCRKVKGLFRHGLQCKIRLPGGCLLCKRMWYLLQLHSRDCKESECTVPRCRDLKEHLKRLQQQAESRRRAAVMEMMRQRAAELQGTDN